MFASHLYPARSDRHPVFMFGHFDLDDSDTGASLVLGEALLAAEEAAAGQRTAALAAMTQARASTPHHRPRRRRQTPV